MKVLYLHQLFLTTDHAGGTRSFEFARRLVRWGHEVTVISGATQYLTDAPVAANRGARVFEERVEGVRVLRVPALFPHARGFRKRAAGFAVFAARALWIGLWLPHHDVLFATSPPLTIAVPGLLISALRRTPLVFEVRDLWPEAAIEAGLLRPGLFARLLAWLSRTAYRQSRAVVTVTAGLRDALTDIGVPERKLHLIRHGADFELFAGLGDQQSARRELGVGEQFVAIYAGNMGRNNALDIVVEAIDLLRDRPGIEAWLLGDGMDRVRLEQLSKGLPNLRLMAAVPKREAAKYVLAADVGLICLRDGGFSHVACPNKFADYLAAGKPVVVDCPGEVANLINEHDIGAYAGKNDPQQLADTLVRLAGDRPALQRMGANARRLAETVFDRDLLARQLEAVLKAAAT